MFKKPRRHFRQRKLTDGSDDEERENDAEEGSPVFSKSELKSSHSESESRSQINSKPAGVSNSAPVKPNGKANSKKKQSSKPVNLTPISFEVDGEGMYYRPTYK